MAKRKETLLQTIIYNTLYRKLNIEQHKTHQKPMWNQVHHNQGRILRGRAGRAGRAPP